MQYTLKSRDHQPGPRGATPASKVKPLQAQGLISAGYLDPLKARIMLHLLIASGMDTDGIGKAFAAADDVPELGESEDSEGADA